jgi:hypothetical protein
LGEGKRKAKTREGKGKKGGRRGGVIIILLWSKNGIMVKKMTLVDNTTPPVNKSKTTDLSLHKKSMRSKIPVEVL